MTFQPEKIDFRNLTRTLVVAEIGVNHEGSYESAVEMIHLAARAGVDAVKFQTYDASTYVSTENQERFARVTRFQLSHEQFRSLAKEAKKAGVVFFSTPLSENDAVFLGEIAPIIKIASGDITHHALLETVARLNKAMIVSTGAATLEEVDAALKVVDGANPALRDTGRLMLMHCVAAYPPSVSELNLANIRTLAKRTGLPVGYSDHSVGTKACELAVAVGAVSLEKHFTYRKEGQVFHDHAVSADPPEMMQLIAAVRRAELLLGSEERTRRPSEEKLLPYMRRSLAVAVDVPAGTAIKEEWVIPLRPLGGLPLEVRKTVIGRKVKRALAKGSLIRAEDLE